MVVNRKFEQKCPKCKEVREITYSQHWNILNGKNTGLCCSCSQRLKPRPDMIGKEPKKAIKKRMSWYNHSEETKKKISDGHKGKILSETTKRKIGKAFLGRKLSREHIQKVLRRRTMSSLEQKFNDIVLKNNLPYKFVGNGEVMIGRKNPDFVNCNGQKIAIEVYCTRHKQNLRNLDIEAWKEERAKSFEEYGWDLLFFNEVEVNEKNIKNKLR